MQRIQRNIVIAASIATGAITAAGCNQVFAPAENLGISAPLSRAAASAQFGANGAVYLMNNAPGGNEILVFARASDGRVTPAGSVPTGGNGTGGGLGNQSSLVLDQSHARLYAVNAGSNSISAFAVTGSGIQLIGAPVASGGTTPVSLTVHGDLLYVLNAGGTGNIAGFQVGNDGGLTAIPGSSRPLSGPAADPAEIQFRPDGSVLAVTEKATNMISTYQVQADGTTSGPASQPAAGETPFGFAFNQRGEMIVSGAGGGPGGSTASSYRIDALGAHLVSGPVGTTQSAACWIAVSQNGGFAFTTNTGSGTLSRLAIGPGGTLSLADAVAGVTGAGTAPQDAAFSLGGRFLYVRNNAGTLAAFRLEGNGALTHLGDFGPLPVGTNGVAAR